MSKIIQVIFDGSLIQFNQDGWFNATIAAERFGKEPTQWLRQRETVEYLSAFAAHHGNSGFVTEFNLINRLPSTLSANRTKLLKLVKQTGYVRTKAGGVETGGGTWLHPKLAVGFARWLDVRFAVWCDMQIDTLIRSQTNQQQRALAVQSKRNAGRLLVDVLNDVLTIDGKTPRHYHFANEHLLVNEVFAGIRGPIDESTLDPTALRCLEALRRRDAIYLARGLAYDERKMALHQFQAEVNSNQGRLSA